MFKTMSVALLVSASCLGAGLDRAKAVEAAAIPQPNVIYADQSVQRPAAVRTASADRSGMGGGFIEFLFGDGPGQGERYQQQPAYQQQPSYQPQGPLLPAAPRPVTGQQVE